MVHQPLGGSPGSNGCLFFLFFYYFFSLTVSCFNSYDPLTDLVSPLPYCPVPVHHGIIFYNFFFSLSLISTVFLRDLPLSMSPFLRILPITVPSRRVEFLYVVEYVY